MLHMGNISKRYPGVVALDDVNLELNPGEILCLVGENGAGKSTLMRILSGAQAMDSGLVMIDGVRVDITSPLVAQRLGIAMIHQELRLIPELSVAENICLGNEPTKVFFLDNEAIERKALSTLEGLGGGIDVGMAVRRLSVAHQQLVAIARALSHKIRFLVMDEPTASLTKHETLSLFRIVKKLASEGIGIIHISHRLEEVFEIADRIAVLRDGKLIRSGPRSDFNRAMVISLMVGRTIENEYPQFHHTAGNEILKLQRISSGNLQNVDLTLHRGEVLGLGGLVGAGRSELARVMFGADACESGSMVLDGFPFHPRSPRDAIESGVGFLTEDRNRMGLIMEMNIRENITLSHLKALLGGPFVKETMERSVVQDSVDRLRIKTPSIENRVTTLSGGNRQKVVLSRWLLTKAKVLIFDEPTNGIDVGVRFEIYRMIHQLADDGLGIIVISSDLPELLGVCDRIMVMSEGRLTGVLGRGEATPERIMELATPMLASR